MLTAEMNDRLTKVGPGTPMGELMRRYWHPIAGSTQLNADNPTVPGVIMVLKTIPIGQARYASSEARTSSSTATPAGPCSPRR